MREHTEGHQCVCRLRLGTANPDAVFKHVGHDSCGVWVGNPDQPVCDYCVAAKHPTQDNFDPCIKEVQDART